MNKTLAHQIRASRDKRGWSQERLASEVGMNQNAISRLESSHYGKPTITTLKRLAAALDVALVVRLVPFSELVDWVSGTPRIVAGLTTEALAVPDFETEDRGGIYAPRDRSLLTSAARCADRETEIPVTRQADPNIAPQTSIWRLQSPHQPISRGAIDKAYSSTGTFQ
ncbi:MAG: helix-turn-helix transcriptional regulator [Bryobacterales bacterium]|nr:helix-turn-helix transcriptional regulator [Bryobacterales bacterium]